MATELLFLDTSVHIARTVSGSSQAARVTARASKYLRSSGLICRQEFKRRVLKEAEFLLDVLNERQTFDDAHAYITRLHQHPYQKRRAAICLGLLAKATGRTDAEKVDLLKTKLRTLIVTGLSQFDGWLDAVFEASGCACGRSDVSERHLRTGRKVYEWGGTKCDSAIGAGCGIVSFLQSRAADLESLHSALTKLPDAQKTDELKKAEAFLTAVRADPASAISRNPCLTVGDIIIAIESVAAGATAVYTMNGKESQHLCKWLGQTLIVRPPDELKDDIVCPGNNVASWPSFG